jgi:hypothetical protein
MKFRRIYTDPKWWFCVFKAEQSDEHVLLATVPGVGCYEIAMKLNPDEVSLFREAPDDFVTLAKDFVASRDWPAFKTRRVEFRCKGEVLETEP